ncbi:hypothetical protein [Streptomyces orinoci]|uniref:Uncharacterized protein n=1 Tax=Streptomyces orinoci TaxID=67339 RepID=A0ABV3JSG2_STRON|nr:hypothetical protein [Streptomyces orinoci]
MEHREEAHLEWWANSTTCLARIPVKVAAAPDGHWDAAVSPPIGPDQCEHLQLLLNTDPCFTLRTADNSATIVMAEHSGDLNRLRLSI